MSVRKKVILILLGVIALYSIVQYALERLIILPSFVALQKAEAQKNIQRCTHAIRDQAASLGNQTADWSSWDDTYGFVLDKNQEFHSALLPESVRRFYG
jgi:sensor domain CHASE-containing protein